MTIDPLCYRHILEFILAEDLGRGDITTDSTVPHERKSEANIIAKDEGVIAGISVAGEIFAMVDPTLRFAPGCTDGTRVNRGTILAELTGKAASILKAERTALNLLQRMSGIATASARCTELTKGTKSRIVDTRKTAPGLRIFDKYAVLVGGGYNHRFNLADGILIKDNHIAAAGGITPAVQSARKQVSHLMKVEVEVSNEEELREALEAGADVIMLDNMSCQDMKKSVEITAGRALLEASGNIGEHNLREVAETGVDFISMGALTHSVKCFDISLKFLS